MLSKLQQLDVGQITPNVSLRTLGSWHIGGPADFLVEPERIDQVSALLRFVHQNGVPLLIVGQGTNLLFDDAGLRGIVMRLGPGFSSCRVAGQNIRAGGGLWVPKLARIAQRAGLAGFEHVTGIPGTLGGLVLMNGGSQRRSIGENLQWLRMVDETGEQVELTAAECGFDYRTSNLQGRRVVIAEVALAGTATSPAEIRRVMLEDLRERRRKFPRKLPNCGSVFLSTSEMHASVGPPGAIIEQTGLKGLRIGAAEVSRLHANFIVNRGGASCQDVLGLIAEIRRQVRARIGFDLHCEVRHVDPQGIIRPAHLVMGVVRSQESENPF